MRREKVGDAAVIGSAKRKQWAKSVFHHMCDNPAEPFFYTSCGDSIVVAVRNSEGMEIFECKVKAVWREE